MKTKEILPTKNTYSIAKKIWSFDPKELTFTDESENPPTTKDPSCDIDEQFNLCSMG